MMILNELHPVSSSIVFLSFISKHCFMEHQLAYDMLFHSETGADVIFELPDGEIQAHKLILTAQAPFFESMFTSGMVEAQTNRIKVADSNVKNFKAMLGFLYTGALRDPFDTDEVMILASKYNLHGMIKVCIAKMQWELCDHRGSSAAFPLVNELVELADKFAVTGVREALEKMLKGWCLTNEHVEPSCNTNHYRVPRRYRSRPQPKPTL